MDTSLRPFPPVDVRRANPMAEPRVEICLHSMPRTPAAGHPARWRMKADRPLKAYSPQHEFQAAQAAWRATGKPRQLLQQATRLPPAKTVRKIGRASCRERV